METIHADRSQRGKLSFTGEQDRWFLHQILTQDFENMGVGDALEAALLTAHGRMVGYLEALRTDEGILAHFEAELIESFPDAIRRYVFATRVEISDLTESHGLVLVAGEGWESAAAQAAPGAPLHPTRALGVPAGYLWIERGAVPGAIESLESAGSRPATEDELEAIRVGNGVPRWGREMDAKALPQESGVDAWAVHYDKGCYVGQEAMAKIHFRGKPNRRLARLEGAGLTPGAEVSAEGAKVGTVTSVADGAALAIVKHTVESGSTVEVDGEEARVL